VVRSIVSVRLKYLPVVMSIHSKQYSALDTNQDVVVRLALVLALLLQWEGKK